MGLDDPESKMSKSNPASNHAVFVLDTPEEIMRKFKKATTDSLTTIEFDPERKAIYNLLSIYEIFSNKSREAITQEFEGKGYGVLKSTIAECVISSLAPIQAEYARIRGDESYLKSVLEQGKNSVEPIAKATYEKVKELVGLV